MYETNEDERNKIRKTLKEKHLLENEEMSDATRSQIHYYENCLIHNRIPFADVRAAFDTAAENVLGTYHAFENRQSFVLLDLSQKSVNFK